MGGLQIVFYFAVLFFIVFVAAKMIKILRMPLHLRWDLYPIPHEKGKGEYGGSYYEEIDWWTKPKNFSLLDEIKEMAKEILFIQSLFRNNRKLWVFSFPFHMGLYLLILLVGLLVLGAILNICGINTTHSSPNALAVFICDLTPIIGNIALVLAIFGSVGLLLSRIFDKTLRKASVISDYTNLLILLAFFVVGFIASLKFGSRYYILHQDFIKNLLTFNQAINLKPILKAELWIFIAILLYMPFTHMTHFVGKYFTYHKIRWEDEPNIRGSKIEKAVTEALGYKINWSAPHIKSGGTWAEAATEEASQDEKG
jgi:nitrate reductase gamma subunit